jgi:hypothetical protein
MAGTVIDWLTGRLREGDVRGGFLARFLFVTATTKTRWLGLTRTQDLAKKNALVAHLARVATMTGEVNLEPIRGPYEAWLHDHEHREPEPALMGFYARLGTYALKLTVLFNLARLTPSLTLAPESWAQAAALAEYLRDQTTDLITNQVTASPYEAKRLRVLTAIKQKPGLKTDALLRTLKLPAREVDEITRTLDMEDSIVIVKDESGPRGGRPATRYYPKEHTGR